MATPQIHAKNSALKYGGKLEDYIDIHQFIDNSKSSFSDARHRAITHNIWFCVNVIPKVFGEERQNSDGKSYSPKDIAEQHCLEDTGMIPTVQDFLENMELSDWMKGESTIEKPVVNLNKQKSISKIEKTFDKKRDLNHKDRWQDPMTIRFD